MCEVRSWEVNRERSSRTYLFSTSALVRLFKSALSSSIFSCTCAICTHHHPHRYLGDSSKKQPRASNIKSGTRTSKSVPPAAGPAARSSSARLCRSSLAARAKSNLRTAKQHSVAHWFLVSDYAKVIECTNLLAHRMLQRSSHLSHKTI